MEITFSRTDDARIIWLQGIGWAVAGGSLAGLCLVFTKAVVKIFYNPGHPVSLSSSLQECSVLMLAPTSHPSGDPTFRHHHRRLPDYMPQQGARMCRYRGGCAFVLCW
jgi:hypothetical protein